MVGIWISASALAVAAVIGGSVWAFRALALRRLNAAADAYATRELTRKPRRSHT